MLSSILIIQVQLKFFREGEVQALKKILATFWRWQAVTPEDLHLKKDFYIAAYSSLLDDIIFF